MGGRPYRVGAGQVDAEAARAGGDEEDEVLVRAVERVDPGLPVRALGGAGQALEFPPTVHDMLFQEVEHGGHL